MIEVGQYFWEPGVPVPMCDGCGRAEAQFKIHVQGKVGIRSCRGCLADLRRALNRLPTNLEAGNEEDVGKVCTR